MRFVDSKKVHLHITDTFFDKIRMESLRSNVKKFNLPIDAVVQSNIYFPITHSRINSQSLNYFITKMLKLIFHQGNQWADDYTYALLYQGWHLEANRFSPTRRH